MTATTFTATCPVCEAVHHLALVGAKGAREIEYMESPPCLHDVGDAIDRAAEEAPEDAWLDAGCARYHGRL